MLLVLVLMFQFQQGSIITDLTAYDDDYGYQFQFQQGSIITKRKWRRLDISCVSIPTRLN